MLLITPSQCRAARALLGWSQPDLAGRCGMHVQTISAFESETGTPTKRTLEKIAITLDGAGAELLSSEGVRRRTQEVKTYTGSIGLNNFFLDVYETVSLVGGDVCISNVDERIFDEHLQPFLESTYVRSMLELKKTKDFCVRILVEEGDVYMPCVGYGEYRWIESKYFHTVPFYVYGNKLGIINFKKHGVTAHVVENKDIADAQRIQFNVFWENAKIPPVG